ncbi:MAG: NAD(P)/FAD-dependent oxidoreductase [Cystobacter sp.]
MAYDAVVVGGGPGGLNAALVLGRSRKTVLLCDAGAPRNAAAVHMHGFGSRDGIEPREFRRISREQLAHYPSVEVRDVQVASVEPRDGGFRVRLGDGTSVDARRILLTLGLVDVPLELPGYKEFWGTSIFQCPYCHGWEHRDQPIGVLASSPLFLDFAVFLQGWSRDVVAFTQGAPPVPAEQRERLTHLGIRIEERRIRAFHGRGGELAEVELEDGARLPRRVLFCHPEQRQRELVKRLGLELDESGFVKVNALGETSVRGLYAAGDMTTRMQGALVAASAGFVAAAMMNHALNMEEADRRYTAATEKPPPERPSAH